MFLSTFKQDRELTEYSRFIYLNEKDIKDRFGVPFLEYSDENIGVKFFDFYENRACNN